MTSAPKNHSSSPDEAPSGGSGTLVIGILGGIASGKSAAGTLLAGPDGLLLSADSIAHGILVTPEVTALVLERFGPGALDANGKPDRTALAKRVFDPHEGPEHRRALEGWIHPRVCETIWSRLRAARAAGVPRVVLDVPLLLENDHKHGWVDACDHLVFVDAPQGERQRRTLDRGWDRDELGRREAAQLPLAEKRARADFVLPNHGDLPALGEHVQQLLSTITNNTGSGPRDAEER
ncbi:MAG: dephospho-CoA kinase [Planctomycetota bacterium]|jgi:dephospho-CoA kinase